MLLSKCLHYCESVVEGRQDGSRENDVATLFSHRSRTTTKTRQHAWHYPNPVESRWDQIRYDSFMPHFFSNCFFRFFFLFFLCSVAAEKNTATCIRTNNFFCCTSGFSESFFFTLNYQLSIFLFSISLDISISDS